MHLKCKMTQDHVDRGEPRKCGDCAAALSTNDGLADSGHPEMCVNATEPMISLYLRNDDWKVPKKLLGVATTPLLVRDFIRAVDDGKKPEPVGPYELYFKMVGAA